MKRKTKILTCLVGCGLLGAWGLSGLIGPTSACVTSGYVKLAGRFDSNPTRVAVDVVDYFNTSTVYCRDLQAGNVCQLQLPSSYSTLQIYGYGDSQYKYYNASGSTLHALGWESLSRPSSGAVSLGFTTLGAQSSVVYFEGDPTIQLLSGTCGG